MEPQDAVIEADKLPAFISERYHRTFAPELERLEVLATRFGSGDTTGATSRVGSLLVRLGELLGAHVQEQERTGGTFEAIAHGATGQPASVDATIADIVFELRAEPASLVEARDPFGKALRFGLRTLADEISDHLAVEQRLFHARGA